MSGCWFPHAKFLIATQQLNWESDGFQSILLMDNSSVLGDIAAKFVTEISSLAEFNGSGYGRQPVSGMDIIEDVGVQVRFTADIVQFVGLNNGSRRARWILIVKNAVNDAARIPIFVIGRSLGPIHPNGGTISVVPEAIW